MTYIVTIFVFLVVFSLLILVHELGHFTAAKRSGIKVKEFGIGLPPRIWGKKKGETIYSVNWIPFGGFVRMLGEDAADPKMLKKKGSFAAQSMRSRFKVIVAGVFMNFLLAWILLGIGFSFGMEPLLLPEDVMVAVDEGVIVLEEGEIESYPSVYFPRVKIFELDEDSNFYRYGLREGDTIISINGRQVYDVVQYESLVRGLNEITYEIFRDGERYEIFVEGGQMMEVIISKVLPDTPAESIGLEAEDIILSVNGKAVNNVLELISFIESKMNEKIAFSIERDGEQIFYEIIPENGKIGVMLSELVNYDYREAMSLYNVEVLSSVVEIKEEQYPPHEAFYKSFGEMFRLSKVTAVMFVNVVKSLVSNGEVPETVAGPVGIAQMTHVFAHEGLIPLLRFVAILSLSLGVINILPFPALDGGRLLFLIVEFIIGRRINQRWEASIHGIGYALILLLILAITYSDILRLLGV